MTCFTLSTPEWLDLTARIHRAGDILNARAEEADLADFLEPLAEEDALSEEEFQRIWRKLYPKLVACR